VDRRTPRAQRTRGRILAAAELGFAERGFEATRLEDVAEQVGIRRASIVYHFRDKRELYDAVLESVFGGFRERLEAALATPGSLTAGIEAAVSAWVDYVGERPTLARLLLREAASGLPGAPPALTSHLRPFFEVVQKFLAGRRDPILDAAPVDPVHVASAIAGTTVFFVAALPSLVPGLGLDPLHPDQLAAHRREVLRITRRLLGVDATPTPATSRTRPGPSKPAPPRERGNS
jgi:TetR/AcrR family transcriptional regulator